MIIVNPTTFTKVDYDAAELASWAQASLERVPMVADDLSLEINIAENKATSTLGIASLDPVVFDVDGGAVENYRDPRTAGELEANIAFTRLLLELTDRTNDAFGPPGFDEELSLAHKSAWDVNVYGRVAALGLRLHPPRFRYNFRNRHGFTDLADQIFDQLWAAETPTWSDITQLSDRATSALTD